MASADSDAAASLLSQKLAVGFATLFLSLFFGLLPHHLSQTNDAPIEVVDETNKTDKCCGSPTSIQEDPTMPPKWLSLATSFGGGVFLGAALLHLLPEASEVLDDTFPLANFLCCIGFLTVLQFEEAIPPTTKDATDASSSSLALVAALSFHSLFDGLAVGSTTSDGQLKAVSIAILAHKPISAFALGSILVCKRLVFAQPQHKYGCDVKPSILQEDTPSIHNIRDKRQTRRRLSSSQQSMAYYYFKYAHDDCDDAECAKKECVCKDLLHLNEENAVASNGSGVTELDKVDTTTSAGYGSCAQESDVLYTKQIQSKDVPMSMILCIVFFSTTSLLGTIIGALGLQYIENSQLAQTYDETSSNPLGATVAAFCQSFAAGSFLYAATMEALVKERGEHHRHHYHHNDREGGHQSMVRTKRVGSALVGMLAMAWIKMLEA
jgi:zinc transporter ZupT